jgi:hypothetical protein
MYPGAAPSWQNLILNNELPKKVQVMDPHCHCYAWWSAGRRRRRNGGLRGIKNITAAQLPIQGSPSKDYCYANVYQPNAKGTLTDTSV